MSATFNKEIERLRNDNTSGAQELVFRALKSLERELEDNPKEILDLFPLFKKIIQVNPEMTVLRNVCLLLIQFLGKHNRGEKVFRHIEGAIVDLDEQVIQEGINELKTYSNICTFSRSSTLQVVTKIST